MSNTQLPEFGIYALPGHALTPRSVFDEVRKADEIGLGSIWLAERLNTKEVGVLSGIATALAPRMGVATGLISNLPMRNPLVVAGYASTMATISDNRFALGIGRGVPALADMTGTSRIDLKILEDYVDILRRLWRGESVTHSGPAGNLNKATLGIKLDVPPPIFMGPLGPKTAHWAGRACDGVVLNSLTNVKALREFIKHVRRGAQEAGRDPASVKVWTILMTACEVPEEVMLQTIIRRMNTYIVFPKTFDMTCELNGWDKALSASIRGKLAEIDGAPKGGTMGDEYTTRELSDLRRMRDLYPEHWIREGCAVGSATECVPALQERFDAGADGILFHGTSPDHVQSLVEAWRRVRPASFDRKSVNPGR